MGPELFNPKKFGLKDGRPTKPSDCYALGMVVYEVLSGKVPFYRYGHYAVVLKVSEGKRPKQPHGAKGAWFGDDLWNLLQHCWKPSPDDRPRAREVLDRLEKVSGSWTPPLRTMADSPTEAPATWDAESSTEESVDECEIVSPPPLQQLKLEGNPNRNLICPSAHHHSALPNGTPDQRALGTTMKNLGGLGESERIVNRVSRMGLLDSTWH